jgi:probable phosphomutase (TIGR03848 family)
VTTVLLVRHGRTAANATGLLAGWTPGVHLDDTGREQAAATAARLQVLTLSAVVASPLERTRETAAALLAGRDPQPPLEIDDRVGECRYGDWTGQPLKSLAKDPMWKVVQAHPSAAVFPGAAGESLAAMSARANCAIRDWNRRLSEQHGPQTCYAVVSHGDVIKAILADALGMHLDSFQRLQVDPGSVSVVRYSELRPFVVRSNDNGGDLSSLRPPKRRRRRRATSDAAVGGGAG